MLDRRIPLYLVALLSILVVTIAVLFAFQSLFSAVGDVGAARVLGRIGLGCLVLLTVDLILLVAAVGLSVSEIGPRPPRDGGDEPQGRD